MADITLTAAVRTNLNTLQSTASLIGDTQERLSTGKKVNSALDNPNSFFTASSLNSRASDLSSLQDDIGQSVSTLEAADQGISAIDKLLDAAKGKANQALQSKDTETRAKYAEEFNELRTQIEDIAKDSGYKGKNLLGGEGNDLLVKFNEDGSSDLNIKSVDYTDLDSDDSTLTLDAIGTTVKSQDQVDFDNNIESLTLGTEKYKAEVDLGAGAIGDNLVGLDSIATGDTLSYTVGSGAQVDLVVGTDVTTVGDVVNSLNSVDGVSASVDVDGKLQIVSDEDITFDATDAAASDLGTDWSGASAATGTLDANTELKDLDGFAIGDSITYKLGNGAEKTFKIEDGTTVGNLKTTLESADGVSVEVSGNQINVDSDKEDLKLGFLQGSGNSTIGAELGSGTGVTVAKDTQAQERAVGNGWGDDNLIEDSLEQVRQTQLDLRAQASTFGTNLSIVTNRQDFTADLINTLEVGAGKLTLADSNLEGANLAALNTQNSIATSTLSLATQAGQSVLQLIR
ncbi:Flagellin [Pseudovibrio sp. W64]|uniref:flagellin N-terminal helical domain-containing protein n=1 Tax=Pseudovibrio sp. W64 TaxID=1735583 RepID=UPI0007AE7754|nr:flagellin hook IN motif-containing protein [Pseudovibrio sp. W64]KZK83799.1 Flagellin [Pseudovibrio sp. W64]